MTKLYELTGQFLELSKLVDDPQMPKEALADSLEGIQGEIELKAEALLQVVAGLDGDTTAIDNEISRLKHRKAVIENRKAALRDYLHRNMEVSGIDKIDCPLFNITLAKPKPMLVITNENEIPGEYAEKVVTIKPKKKEILKALKAGNDVPGCAIGESKRALIIK